MMPIRLIIRAGTIWESRYLNKEIRMIELEIVWGLVEGVPKKSSKATYFLVYGGLVLLVFPVAQKEFVDMVYCFCLELSN